MRRSVDYTHAAVSQDPTEAQVREPEVSYFRTRSIEVGSDPPSPVEVDGDLVGTRPARFTVVPQAVKFMCPE